MMKRMHSSTDVLNLIFERRYEKTGQDNVDLRSRVGRKSWIDEFLRSENGHDTMVCSVVVVVDPDSIIKESQILHLVVSGRFSAVIFSARPKPTEQLWGSLSMKWLL